MNEYFTDLRARIKQAQTYRFGGRITQIIGMTVESVGPVAHMGDICRIYPSGDEQLTIPAEVVGFRGTHLLLQPFGPLSGIAPGDVVITTGETLTVAVGRDMRGRVLDALGRPFDQGGPIHVEAHYAIDNDPPNPLVRRQIQEAMPLGVRAIDGLLTVGNGQRIGIFAGSGVGKSSLLGMIARSAVAEVNVIVLIGERGREVNDFIHKDLRKEGMEKTVLLVATSDQPALLRLKSALVGTAIAEFFRDCGMSVLLMMDSLTRFAMAQREIGMAVGEPPVSHGYTPSVYAKLPRLLERSGTSDKGSITGIYTVLVEGDDINEPISDTVRGILDGHIVLTRKLANNNHYPPIDVLQSVSRLMPSIVTPEHWKMAGTIKNLMASYREAQDLINIGAYKMGSNPEIDRAVRLHSAIDQMLIQQMDDCSTLEDAISCLEKITTQ